MFAKEALEEIEQWRQQSTPPEQQLDRRWIELYRQLAASDSFWWLTWAGPFTEEEQQQWDRQFVPPIHDATKEQLAPLLQRSRERELAAALAEQREPRLRYPAIDILDVRQRIARDLVQLDTDIAREEPNTVVRRLYHGAIEEELDFLRLIEATYEGDTATFWECNLHSLPLPTVEEMEYALDRVKWAVQRGSTRQETAEVSQQLAAFTLREAKISPSGVIVASYDRAGEVKTGSFV